MAQFLLDHSLRETGIPIDIHTFCDYSFRVSCRSGHLDVAQWLYNISKQPPYKMFDIRAYDDQTFEQSCDKGQLNVAQWLASLESNYIIDSIKPDKIEYRILKN